MVLAVATVYVVHEVEQVQQVPGLFLPRNAMQRSNDDEVKEKCKIQAIWLLMYACTEYWACAVDG